MMKKNMVIVGLLVASAPLCAMETKQLESLQKASKSLSETYDKQFSKIAKQYSKSHVQKKGKSAFWMQYVPEENAIGFVKPTNEYFAYTVYGKSAPKEPVEQLKEALVKAQIITDLNKNQCSLDLTPIVQSALELVAQTELVTSPVEIIKKFINHPDSVNMLLNTDDENMKAEVEKELIFYRYLLSEKTQDELSKPTEVRKIVSSLDDSIKANKKAFCYGILGAAVGLGLGILSTVGYNWYCSR